MKDDILVIKRFRPGIRHRKPVMVSNEIYGQLEALSEQSGHLKGILADKIIEWALPRIQIDEGGENNE